MGGGKTADSRINVTAEAEEVFFRELNRDKRVEEAYLYTSLEARHVDGVGLMTRICDDFAKENNKDGIFRVNILINIESVIAGAASVYVSLIGMMVVGVFC